MDVGYRYLAAVACGARVGRTDRQADGRTPDRCVDLSPSTMRAMPVTSDGVLCCVGVVRSSRACSVSSAAVTDASLLTFNTSAEDGTQRNLSLTPSRINDYESDAGCSNNFYQVVCSTDSESRIAAANSRLTLSHAGYSQYFTLGRKMSSPQKIPISLRDPESTRFGASANSYPKRHLDWFSRLCRGHACNQQTDTMTTQHL